jgi:hypothetical protein
VEKVYSTPEERARFYSDCAEYNLAWKCTDCVHLVDATGRCALEYPNHDLAAATCYDTPEGTYVFCKHFELK